MALQLHYGDGVLLEHLAVGEDFDWWSLVKSGYCRKHFRSCLGSKLVSNLADWRPDILIGDPGSALNRVRQFMDEVEKSGIPHSETGTIRLSLNKIGYQFMQLVALRLLDERLDAARRSPDQAIRTNAILLVLGLRSLPDFPLPDEITNVPSPKGLFAAKKIDAWLNSACSAMPNLVRERSLLGQLWVAADDVQTKIRSLIARYEKIRRQESAERERHAAEALKHEQTRQVAEHEALELAEAEETENNARSLLQPLLVGAQFFDEIGSVVEDLINVKIDGKWGFIDTQGNWIVEPEFDDVRAFSSGLAAVQRGSSWGYINAEGQICIRPSFHEAHDFSDAVAAVGIKSPISGDVIFGAINREGRFVLNPQFDDFSEWKSGLASVVSGDKSAIVNSAGQLLSELERGPEIDDLPPLTVLAKLTKTARHDQPLFPENGEFVIPGKNGNSFIFKDGLARLHDTMWERQGSLPAFFSPFGFPSVGVYQSGFEAQLAAATVGLVEDPLNEYVYINTQGDAQIKIRAQRAGDFIESRAAVKVDNLWGFIDAHGTVDIRPQFDSIFPYNQHPLWNPLTSPAHFNYQLLDDPLGDPGFRRFLGNLDPGAVYSTWFGANDTVSLFSSGLLPASVAGMWGYIDRQGLFDLPPQFAAARPFSEGLAAVCVDGKWGYIDSTGAMVIAPSYNYAGEFTDGLAFVRILDATGPRDSDGVRAFVGAIDRSGRWIIEPKFQRLERLGKGVISGRYESETQIHDFGSSEWVSEVTSSLLGGNFTYSLIDYSGNLISADKYCGIKPLGSEHLKVDIDSDYSAIIRITGSHVTPPFKGFVELIGEGYAKITVGESEGLVDLHRTAN